MVFILTLGRTASLFNPCNKQLSNVEDTHTLSKLHIARDGSLKI